MRWRARTARASCARPTAAGTGSTPALGFRIFRSPLWRRSPTGRIGSRFRDDPTGLYRSPNGGRAWKAANRGLEGCIVLSIAPSPNFASDGVVFAGTVSDGIFRSCDGGITWQPCLVMPNPNDQIAAVNAFWLRPADNAYLAGLDDGQFLRSTDRGATWAPAADEPAAVLCFFGQEDRLYAGTADAGLLASDDSGRAWSADATLAARQFTSLFRSEGGGLFAAGADEGVWYSGDGGRCWANAGDFDSILLTAAVADDDCHTRLAGTASGLFRADDASPDWELVAPPPDVTALRFSRAFVEDRRVWAGTWSGDIFASGDGGQRGSRYSRRRSRPHRGAGRFSRQPGV
ncbi:MAG: hypothetical protein U0703_09175 [Anaerolineae bacterium]